MINELKKFNFFVNRNYSARDSKKERDVLKILKQNYIHIKFNRQFFHSGN